MEQLCIVSNRTSNLSITGHVKKWQGKIFVTNSSRLNSSIYSLELIEEEAIKDQDQVSDIFCIMHISSTLNQIK